MSTIEITLILVGLIVVALLAGLGWFYLRRQQLRHRFGPEYDRVVSEQDSARAAEKELRERERRHAELKLKELSPDARRWYAEQWQHLQARFVEAPDEAVGAADELATRLISERGYPRDYDEQVSLLSVEHARTIGDYREAHDIAQRHAKGEAGTEELRQALVHYRTLVADLLGQDPVPHEEPNTEGAHEIHEESARRSRRGA